MEQPGKAVWIHCSSLAKVPVSIRYSIIHFEVNYESKKQNLDKQIADKRLELKGLENLDGTENDMKKRIEAIRMH